MVVVPKKSGVYGIHGIPCAQVCRSDTGLSHQVCLLKSIGGSRWTTVHDWWIEVFILSFGGIDVQRIGK